MDNYLWLIILVIIIVAVAIFLPSRRYANKGETLKRHYDYLRKDYVMSEVEMKLFHRLERLAGDRYYIFPQIHLSSLLYHKVRNGQNWNGALSKVQRKSVDFVLADKVTLKTVYAVELDDSTHDRPIRQKRDSEVEQYFLNAGIPLVRLRGIDSMSDEDIENAFRSHASKIVS